MPIKITSVTINGGVNLCYGEQPVPIPNWVAGVDVEENHGSRRPGAFLISNPTGNSLDVGLYIDESGIPGPVTLVGTIGDRQFNSAPFTPEPGAVTVSVLPLRTPSHFLQIQGDIHWRLDDSDSSTTPLGATRMEIFWLYDRPGGMYKKGAWVEVLRLLADQCYRGLHSREEIITRVVNYCNAGSGLSYDIADSTSHYTQTYWGGGFNLKAFLNKTYPLCICTDLAGLVQVMLAAIGLPADYCYTHPFGFLNDTNLIGRGQINNTYFLGREPAPEIVPRFSPKRWGFGSHAFCTHGPIGDRRVLDACAGPHVGRETVPQYLETVIDRHPRLYPDPRESLRRPAEVTDVYTCTGITDVHSITCRAGLCKDLQDTDERLTRFKQRTGLTDITSITPPGPPKYVVCDWLNPATCPSIGASWSLGHQSVRGGCQSALKEWHLQRGVERIKINVYVSSGDTVAPANHLLNTVSSSPLPEIPFQRRVMDPLGHFHVAAQQKEFWLYYNVCFLVESNLPHTNLTPICQWLQEQAALHLADTLLERPRFADPETDPLYIIMKNRETKTLTVFPQPPSGPEPYLLDYFIEDSILQISAETAPTIENPEQAYSLTLKALSPGLTDIALYLVNRRNLLCSKGVRIYCEVDKETP